MGIPIKTSKYLGFDTQSPDEYAREVDKEFERLFNHFSGTIIINKMSATNISTDIINVAKIRPIKAGIQAIQLQDNDNNNILTVDSINHYIGIGTNTPTNDLVVSNTGASADVAISCSNSPDRKASLSLSVNQAAVGVTSLKNFTTTYTGINSGIFAGNGVLQFGDGITGDCVGIIAAPDDNSSIRMYAGASLTGTINPASLQLTVKGNPAPGLGGTITVHNDLIVDGDATLTDTTTTNLNVTGNTNLGDLTASAIACISVEASSASLGQLTATNFTTYNISATNLGVTGNTNLALTTLTNLNSTNITTTNLGVTGECSLPNTTMTSLTVTTLSKCLAYLTTADQIVSHNTVTTIGLNAESYDIGSDFNTGTYTYTVPATGYYWVGAKVGYCPTVVGGSYQARIEVNGTLVNNIELFAADTNGFNLPVTPRLEYLTSGQTVLLRTYHTAGVDQTVKKDLFATWLNVVEAI